MARVDELFNFLQTPGLSDQQIAAEINRLGVTPSEVSQLTGVPVADVQARLSAATPAATAAPVSTAPTFGTAGETQLYNYLQTPGLTDAQIRAEINRLGVTAQQVSSMTGVPLADVQRRIAGTTTTTTPPVVTTTTTRPPVVTTPPTTNLTAFETWLRSTPGLTDAQIMAEMARRGITNREVSGITGVPVTDVENRVNALSATFPFANATQGMAQTFQNYTSIPIGAQFNPGVVGGAGSPYAQIMRQMTPVGNPYATARAGLPLGGYDPSVYDPNLLSNFVRQRAAELRAAGLPVPLGFDGGGDGAGGVGGASGGGSGDAAADAAAAAADAAAAAAGEGAGPGTGAGWYMGGLIDKVTGPKPNSPDDGQINAQVGEYVIKKSSVNKYGKGLLDMMNEGKIPAKKIKSLLD